MGKKCWQGLLAEARNRHPEDLGALLRRWGGPAGVEDPVVCIADRDQAQLTALDDPVTAAEPGTPSAPPQRQAGRRRDPRTHQLAGRQPRLTADPCEVIIDAVDVLVRPGGKDGPDDEGEDEE